MIKSHGKTVVKKDLTKELFSRIKGAKNSYVSIGIHNDAGSYTEGKNPPEVYEVALWNEFGTDRGVPERSFIRSTIDENEGLFQSWRQEMIVNILEKNWTLEKALSAIGFRIQTLVQNKIKSNVPPPNAPSTVAEKARDGVAPNTLIHTGLMLRSVTFKVFLND